MEKAREVRTYIGKIVPNAMYVNHDIHGQDAERAKQILFENYEENLEKVWLWQEDPQNVLFYGVNDNPGRQYTASYNPVPADVRSYYCPGSFIREIGFPHESYFVLKTAFIFMAAKSRKGFMNKVIYYALTDRLNVFKRVLPKSSSLKHKKERDEGQITTLFEEKVARLMGRSYLMRPNVSVSTVISRIEKTIDFLIFNECPFIKSDVRIAIIDTLQNITIAKVKRDGYISKIARLTFIIKVASSKGVKLPATIGEIVETAYLDLF
jgi:hypothetical protein